MKRSIVCDQYSRRCRRREEHCWNCLRGLHRISMRLICIYFWEQGELISQVPEYVNILNRDYTAESVLSAEGKKEIEQKSLL